MLSFVVYVFRVSLGSTRVKGEIIPGVCKDSF
jgi:hypothetical protein